jgi:hypothetical protein
LYSSLGGSRTHYNFINFRALCTTIDDYQLIGGFFAKKQNKKLGVVLGVPSGFLLEQ